jgi:hypothetical protein
MFSWYDCGVFWLLNGFNFDCCFVDVGLCLGVVIFCVRRSAYVGGNEVQKMNVLLLFVKVV